VAAAAGAPRAQLEPELANAVAPAHEQTIVAGMDGIAAPGDRTPALPAAVMPPRDPSLPALHLDIGTPLASSNWDQQLGQRVIWMAGQHHQVAEIRLNPPELGPVELRLTLDSQQGGQQASLHFASPHAEVRETLENALPRLRELMADAGISLGNATVGSESFSRQPAPEQGRQSAQATAATPHGSTAAAVAATRAPLRRGSGLVDTFA
jgi:flagellar hook-length control protein FliK